MATDTQESSTLALGEINKYDFRTNSPTVFKARRGLDAGLPAKVARDLQQQADARMGWQTRHRLPGYFLLPEADRAAGENLG